MWKLKHQRTDKGFTIIELLVTIGIIAMLAGIGVVTVSKIRNANQQTQCVNNLRAISQGLQLYYNDYMTFPEDGYPDDGNDIYPLSTDLAGYINNKSTFVCPEDKDTTSIGNFASYDPYYVARNGSYDTDELAIGCPRHRGAKNSTSAFSTGSTEITKVGTVLDKNDQEIPPDGTLYSIVKVQDDGMLRRGLNSRLLHRAQSVGVRGTEFTVQTSDNGSVVGYKTDVVLTSGIVVVTDRETGKATILKSGGTTSMTTGDTPMHSHWHTHADGTRHKHDHPPKNQAHHGKPGSGEDDESS